MKPGAKLSVSEHCKKGDGHCVLTNVCLSDAETANVTASLLLHTPDGRKLTVARVAPPRAFARLDLQIDSQAPGFALEALGAGLDIVGFREPGDLSGGADGETPPATQSKEKSPAAKESNAKTPESQKPQAATKKPEAATKKPEAETPQKPAEKPQKPDEKEVKASDQSSDFIASKRFTGAKSGMVFKLGKRGLGYYKDTYVAPKAGVKRKAEVTPAAVAPPPKKAVTLSGGLKYEVVKSGSGQKAVKGRNVQVRYDGRLATTGKRFDKGTIRFKLGAGEVIKGWDLGVEGMVIGEKRKLLIPPALGYGRSGAPPDIPPNATLAFEVELLRI